jgi:hypothetical protein
MTTKNINNTQLVTVTEPVLCEQEIVQRNPNLDPEQEILQSQTQQDLEDKDVLKRGIYILLT